MLSLTPPWLSWYAVLLHLDSVDMESYSTYVDSIYMESFSTGTQSMWRLTPPCLSWRGVDPLILNSLFLYFFLLWQQQKVKMLTTEVNYKPWQNSHYLSRDNQETPALNKTTELWKYTNIVPTMFPFVDDKVPFHFTAESSSKSANTSNQAPDRNFPFI